jgi:hypothetical protein
LSGGRRACVSKDTPSSEFASFFFFRISFFSGPSFKSRNGSNEKFAGSERRQWLGINLGLWRLMAIFRLNMQFLCKKPIPFPLATAELRGGYYNNRQHSANYFQKSMNDWIYPRNGNRFFTGKRHVQIANPQSPQSLDVQ